ncbi:MAG: hypothetical protein H6934_06145 [Burkholderiaceae bacterium]|nr:hypothetical protein [Burkholderiaceae bacterium]
MKKTRKIQLLIITVALAGIAYAATSYYCAFCSEFIKEIRLVAADVSWREPEITHVFQRRYALGIPKEVALAQIEADRFTFLPVKDSIRKEDPEKPEDPALERYMAVFKFFSGKQYLGVYAYLDFKHNTLVYSRAFVHDGFK